MATNPNKYTILVSGQLDTKSIDNMQKSLDNVKNLSAKINDFKVSDSAIKNLKTQIEAGLKNINVGVSGYSSSGSRSATQQTRTVEFNSGSSAPLEFSNNRELVAQYEQIVSLVNQATDGAQARIKVEMDSQNVAQKIVATYSDLDNKTKTIKYNLELMGEAEEEHYEWVYKGAQVTQDNVKTQREWLRELDKFDRQSTTMDRTINQLSPDAGDARSMLTSYKKMADEDISNIRTTIEQMGAPTEKQIERLKQLDSVFYSVISGTKQYGKEYITQVTKVTGTMNKASNMLAELGERDPFSPQVRSATEASNAVLNYGKELQTVLASGENLSENQIKKFGELNQTFEENSRRVRALGKDTMGFAHELGVAIRRTLTWSVAMGAFYGSLRKMKEGVQFIKDMDAALTNVGLVTGQKVEEMKGLAQEYSDIARELGTSTSAVAEGALEFIRQGLSKEETDTLIRVSTMQAKLANMNAAQSTEYLTSIMNGFKLQADDMIGVLDVLINLDNRYASSVGF